MLTAQQYAIYKGMSGKFGAVQFNFQNPHLYHPETKEKDWSGTKFTFDDGTKAKVREGCVFVTITSAKGKNDYNWDEKITVALSVNDLGQILYFLRSGKNAKNGEAELKLMHDPGAKSAASGKVQKHITLNSPNGIAKGFLFNVAQLSGQDRKFHTVPISGDETMVLSTLFQTAISRALAW